MTHTHRSVPLTVGELMLMMQINQPASPSCISCEIVSHKNIKKALSFHAEIINYISDPKIVRAIEDCGTGKKDYSQSVHLHDVRRIKNYLHSQIAVTQYCDIVRACAIIENLALQ